MYVEVRPEKGSRYATVLVDAGNETVLSTGNRLREIAQVVALREAIKKRVPVLDAGRVLSGDDVACPGCGWPVSAGTKTEKCSRRNACLCGSLSDLEEPPPDVIDDARYRRAAARIYDSGDSQISREVRAVAEVQRWRGGAFVQAWVWVDDAALIEEDKED